ncbi:Nn.00g096030.m01.CDS01 [Neocucurbitaria sp. VM-36]
MSGDSAEDAISFSDDEADSDTYSEDEVDVQRYDSDDATDDDDDDEPILDDGDEGISIFENAPPVFVPSPETFELPSLSHECGFIRPGSVVELKDHSERTSNHLLSGKLNDLFMLIEVQEGDKRPRFVQGLEDIAPEEVTRVRRCVFTHLNHQLLGQSQVNLQVPHRLKTEHEKREWIFHRGILICRWVYVVERHHNEKSYGGEARRMYEREVADFTKENQFSRPPSAQSSTPPTVRAHSEIQPLSKHAHKRGDFVQETVLQSSKRFQQLPQKSRVYTFGDGYCGIGGVSEGARQAGYRILWGLENNPTAMEAYRQNFPGAKHLEMDACDFVNMAKRGLHGCDHLHMSCPCCFWSQAHTNEGKNDEANIATLFTVEAWLEKLKSRTFSLEQAAGLLKLEKHRKFFRILLNGILNRGYNVRWKIQDQAWFGIAQHRRRLIFVGAKIGTPLPPFPSPIHGPKGSGLRRFVTVEDALRPLEQQALGFRHDPYHQPDYERCMDEKAYDPHVNLAKCITTSGGDNVHHSGTRSYTCRELSRFQGLPMNFHFAGSVTEAKKQCGNVWPTKANKEYFQTWAAHMEAFDYGLIGAEDEVLDLYDFLENKGITIPKPEPIDLDFFPTPVRRSGTQEPEYRYLHRIEKTIEPRVPLQLWGKRMELDPLPQQRRRRNSAVLPVNFFSSPLQNVLESSARVTVIRRERRRRRARDVIRDDDEIITIDDSD